MPFSTENINYKYVLCINEYERKPTLSPSHSLEFSIQFSSYSIDYNNSNNIFVCIHFVVIHVVTQEVENPE